jgi:hypothetical protein
MPKKQLISEKESGSKREGHFVEKMYLGQVFFLFISLFLIFGCVTLGTQPGDTVGLEGGLSPHAEIIDENINPYLADTIINNASLPFDPMGVEFPFYRTTFWDNFTPAHFEVLETEDD